MNYEKKYKDALEKARQLCAYPTSKPFISDLQDLFPELKESEDDVIRKEIISYLKTRKGYTEAIKDPWIAWLEKQGEQKPAEWSKEYNKMMKAIIEDIHCGTDFCAEAMQEANKRENWLKSLKHRVQPQNTWKPSDEQMEMVDKIINALSQMQLFGGRNALIDLKHDLEKLREE